MRRRRTGARSPLASRPSSDPENDTALDLPRGRLQSGGEIRLEARVVTPIDERRSGRAYLARNRPAPGPIGTPRAIHSINISVQETRKASE